MPSGRMLAASTSAPAGIDSMVASHSMENCELFRLNRSASSELVLDPGSAVVPTIEKLKFGGGVVTGGSDESSVVIVVVSASGVTLPEVSSAVISTL